MDRTVNRRHTAAAAALASLAAVTAPAGALHAQGAGAETPSAAHQIASAVLAAPAEHRATAKVLGWDDEGRVVTLREGSDGFVCLADNPADEAWSVSCYPTSIEPYMARGRAMRQAGITDRQQLLQQRWDEADEGTLAMPKAPATVYILHGRGFDEEAGEVIEPFLRWAIYTPWATPESTGLPTQPTGPGAPWLMFPGTAGAHIMITPAPPGSGGG